MKDFDECDAVSEKRSLGLEQPERGSFMVAGALFMVVFLMIAGLGVDVANFFNTQSKVQSIADGAALAGANAMNQFSDTPDKHKAFQAALNHIRTKQGDTYAEMYDPNFKTQDGRIVITGPDRDTEGDTFYKVGVVAMGKFESYFLPRGSLAMKRS